MLPPFTEQQSAQKLVEDPGKPRSALPDVELLSHPPAELFALDDEFRRVFPASLDSVGDRARVTLRNQHSTEIPKEEWNVGVLGGNDWHPGGQGPSASPSDAVVYATNGEAARAAYPAFERIGARRCPGAVTSLRR